MGVLLNRLEEGKNLLDFFPFFSFDIFSLAFTLFGFSLIFKACNTSFGLEENPI